MNEFSHALYYQIFDLKPGKGEERKLKILEAFIHQVASKGLEHISFETIGKAVKMQRTHITYYFQTRDELIRASIRYAVAVGQRQTIAETEKAKGWREKLKAVVAGPFEWINNYPEHGSVMLMFYYLSTHDKKYRELQNTIRQMGEDRILGCLEPYGELKKLSLGELRALARWIQNLITGALVTHCASDYPVGLKEIRASVIRSVEERLK